MVSTNVDQDQAVMMIHRIHWTLPMLCGCALVGLVAGTIGGLLGLGGGFLLGPVLLEMGVPPEVIRRFNHRMIQLYNIVYTATI
jgi:uncharacterized membrane protein YfcA